MWRLDCDWKWEMWRLDCDWKWEVWRLDCDWKWEMWRLDCENGKCDPRRKQEFVEWKGLFASTPVTLKLGTAPAPASLRSKLNKLCKTSQTRSAPLNYSACQWEHKFTEKILLEFFFTFRMHLNLKRQVFTHWKWANAPIFSLKSPWHPKNCLDTK